MTDMRARRLAILVCCSGLLAACRPAGPAGSPAPAPVRVAVTPRVVPQPVSLTLAGGDPFTLASSTGIVVDAGNPEVLRVANQLAALLRSATAFAVPISSSGATAPGAIALRLTSDAAL